MKTETLKKHNVELLTDEFIKELADNLGNDGDAGLSCVSHQYKSGFISGMKLARVLLSNDRNELSRRC